MKSKFNFSIEYIKSKRPRSLVNDIDNLWGYGNISNLPSFVKKVDKVLVKLDAILPILSSLDATFNNPL